MLTRAELTSEEIEVLLSKLGQDAKTASGTLSVASPERKHAALVAMAEAIERNRDEILSANAVDMDNGQEAGLSSALLDRLKLDNDRISAMANGIRAIADLKDPVGEVIAAWERPNGLKIERVRTPLGVIGVIYESRPNVTADAGALCLKAGNAVILRGGSDSAHSSAAIHACMVEGLKAANLPEAAIQLVPTVDRAAVGALLKGLGGTVDVIVPRGGKSLVERVQTEARVPVFAHLEGLCHIYVHDSAQLDMTIDIVTNAKMRRTGICGAVETVLFDGRCAATHLVPTLRKLAEAGCEIRGTEEICLAWPEAKLATAEDWSTE